MLAPRRVAPPAQRLMMRGARLLRPVAVTALRNFLGASPKPEERADALLLMAHALLNLKEHAEAIAYLNQMLAEFPSSELAPQARLILGGAYHETGNLDAALPVLMEAKSQATSPDMKR